ncbi:hypothetical protein QOZ73_32810, partial [Pseudomonas aeruginosa]|uniref:hypothetical protein n=1 Tax=Pseudomonas aeruginosa TaxID=287 RepID=UPI00345A1845
NWVKVQKTEKQTTPSYTERKQMYLDNSLLKVNTDSGEEPLTEEQKLTNNQLLTNTLEEETELGSDKLSAAFNQKILQKLKALGADPEA